MKNIVSASTMKQKIMRRVYSIWLMRQAAPLVLIELPLLAISGYLAAKFIFVERVMQNMAISVSGFADTVRFVAMAFINTRAETQLVLGLSMLAVIFFTKDFLKSIRGISLMVTAH